MVTFRRNLHALAGAYALDALAVTERARFERHLRTCRSCQEELRGYVAAAAALGMAVAAQPPAALRERVLGAVAVLDSARSADAAIAAVLSAPDARTASAATSAGGTATVVASVAEGKVVFTTSGLRALSPAEVYELWFIGAAGARPAGLLPMATARGDTAPLLAAGLAAGDKVGVTVEPAGGTASPTTTPIVVMALA
jgi:anti-sigma-K factor RskA